VHTLPNAGKDDLDKLLAQVGDEFDRAVVLGEDSDLNAVVVRLLRNRATG